MTNYYYIVMSQKDMLENQVLEEILRERANYYLSKNKSITFWLLNSPNFLYNSEIQKLIKSSNFYLQKKKELSDKIGSQYYSVLISSNQEFINWIKLRLGFFEKLSDIGKKDIKESFVSDGISGDISIYKEKSLVNYLKNNRKLVHPSILSSKLETTLEIINSKNLY